MRTCSQAAESLFNGCQSVESLHPRVSETIQDPPKGKQCGSWPSVTSYNNPLVSISSARDCYESINFHFKDGTSTEFDTRAYGNQIEMHQFDPDKVSKIIMSTYNDGSGMAISLYAYNMKKFSAGFSVDEGEKSSEVILSEGERIIGVTVYRVDGFISDLQFIIAEK